MFGIITKTASQIASLPGNIIQTLQDAYHEMYPSENSTPPTEIKQLVEELDKETAEIQDIDEDSDSEYDTAESGESEEEEELEENVITISPELNFIRREHVKIGREIADSNYVAIVPDGMPEEDDYITLLQNNEDLITHIFTEERNRLGNIKVRMGIKCTMKRLKN